MTLAHKLGIDVVPPKVGNCSSFWNQFLSYKRH